jgi:hypothetical protein
VLLHARVGLCLPADACRNEIVGNASYECGAGLVCCDDRVGCTRDGCGGNSGDMSAGAGGT